MALKLVFLPADGEAPWLLLPSSVSLLSGSTEQPENTYYCILKLTGQVWESQKGISINTNHSYHHRSSLYASLDWSNDKIRFSFNQPNKKRWGARLVHIIKYLPHEVFLLWHHHLKNGIILKRSTFSQGFPYWEDGGSPPQPTNNLLISSHLEKLLWVDPPKAFIPITNGWFPPH